MQGRRCAWEKGAATLAVCQAYRTDKGPGQQHKFAQFRGKAAGTPAADQQPEDENPDRHSKSIESTVRTYVDLFYNISKEERKDT